MNKYGEAETRFKNLQQSKPEAGDILECLLGEPASIEYEKSGKDCWMFTTAVIDAQATGWYLKFVPYGLKVLIDRKDHDKVLQLPEKDTAGRPTVTRLRVIRRNLKCTALIAELME